MKIAEYFAEFSIRPDRNSIRRVDSELKKLENKLRGFGKNSTIKLKLSGFNVDQPALRLALSNSLDIASKSVAFEISKFVVNDRNLQAALLRAARRLPPLPPGPNPPPLPPRPGPYPPDSRRGSGAASGFIGGGVARLYSPALALAFGGYGLAQLNKRNQQVVSAQLQSEAVVQQAGGTVEEGKASFEYLRKTANRVGFNYLDASADYNTLLSNVTGSGKSVEEGQKIFTGFSELSRTLKLGKVQQQRVFKALSDISGKGQLQAQELKLQLGQALPGAQSLFAKAYQNELAATGKGKGDLTGQAAIGALLEAMKKGLVKSSVLKYAAEIASERASYTLPTASQASQAEQAKYQNSVSDLAVVASDAGIEEGFARIFRTLAAGLDESNGLVRILAEGFNDATKFADDLLLFPQSFTRALEGRDSLVADWLGIDSTARLVADWKEIRNLWEQIAAIKPENTFGDFLPTLEATAKEIAGILSTVSKLKQLNDNASASADIVQADIASRGTGPVSNFFSGLAGSFAGVSAYVSTPLDIEESNNYRDYVESNYPRGAQFIKNKEQLEAIQNNFRLQPFDPLSNSQASLGSYNDALSSEFVGLLYPRSSNGFPSLDTTPSGAPFKDLSKYDSRSPSEIEDYNPRNSMILPGEFPFSLPSLDTTPSGAPFEDLSKYNSRSPSEIEDYNKQQALAQADQSSVVNNVTNQFDINISVDATLAGIEIEQQAQAMAEAFSTSLTGAFEQVQVNFPQK